MRLTLAIFLLLHGLPGCAVDPGDGPPALPFAGGGSEKAASTRELIEMLSHAEHTHRVLAQWALAERGDARDAVKAALADKSKSNTARIHALWTLAAMADQHKGYNPVKEFITALHNGPDELRAQAARALGTKRFDAKAAVKGLIHRAKNDTDARVRMQAAATLGRIAGAEAAAELYSSLDDEDRFAWLAKVQALRAINAWDAAPAFLNSSDERTREGTVLALTGVYDDGAVAALVHAVSANPYPEVRARAVEALAEVSRKADPDVKGWWDTQPARGKPAREKRREWSGTKAAAAALTVALKDTDERVRIAAARAIEEHLVDRPHPSGSE